MKRILVPFLFGMAVMGFAWSLMGFAADLPGDRPVTGSAGPGPSGSRFRIVEIPGVHATAWLLDTREGRVWRQHLFPELRGNNQVWIYMPRIDGPDTFREWYQQQERITPEGK